MDAVMRDTVSAAGQKARYDEQVKKLLGHKTVLAYILIHTVDEFKGMRPGDAAELIEGEPMIGVVPVEPGRTNAEITDDKEPEYADARTEDKRWEKPGKPPGRRIVGFNTEQGEIQEGRVYFDIVFYARTRDGLAQIIVNLEAQQRERPSEYHVLNRALFYVCRLVSSQKERDFTGVDFDAMKRVYSIWICMGRKENSMEYVHLTKEALLGSTGWAGLTELLNVVLIGLSEEIPQHDEKYELHRLLGTILSQEMPERERLEILDAEYEFSEDESVRKDVKAMCNLSEGIWEKGLEKGLAQGMEKGLEKGLAQGLEKGLAQGMEKSLTDIILNMYRKGYDSALIADAVNKSVPEVQAMIENALALVNV